ncbi:MAG: hypothetical protein M3N53_06245 [Actinomycetota bacterium]|nr:hypothetical protein [Actinomycetota bacterium]
MTTTAGSWGASSLRSAEGEDFERALVELGFRVAVHLALENESSAAARPLILATRFGKAVG